MTGYTLYKYSKEGYEIIIKTDSHEHYKATVDFAKRLLGHPKPQTNADRIRAMNDEELAEFLTHINPTNCQDCAFSHGWRCQPDRDDYSDFEKCKEGRKRWLQQPVKENDYEYRLSVCSLG